METYFQRQAAAVRDAAARCAEPDQPRRSARRRRSLEAGGRPVTYAIGRPADITPGPLSFSLDGLTFDVRTPRGTLHVRSKLVGRPNVYNILAAVVAGDRARSAVRRDRDAASRSLDGVPGPLSGRLGAEGRSHRRRRLRAHRRCAAQPARDGAAAGARPADHGVRLRRRSRSHQAAADGRGGRPAERRDRDHVGQPAQRGSGRGSSRRFSAASRPTRRRDSAPADLLTIVDRARGDRARRSSWRGPATSC